MDDILEFIAKANYYTSAIKLLNEFKKYLNSMCIFQFINLLDIFQVAVLMIIKIKITDTTKIVTQSLSSLPSFVPSKFSPHIAESLILFISPFAFLGKVSSTYPNRQRHSSALMTCLRRKFFFDCGPFPLFHKYGRFQRNNNNNSSNKKC